MEYITLNNGLKMPMVGLGTWKSKPEEVGQAVEYALTKSNYEHIDCAHIYGNEKEIGQALNKVFLGNQVKREDIFITSKLWNNSHAKEEVEKACKVTLNNLQLDYLDLYLMHWGVAVPAGENKEPLDKNGVLITENISVRETWEAMEKLVDAGLVKSIGVANFNADILLDLLSYVRIKPAVNQIELHPYNPQTKLLDFCKYKDIGVTAYSPLGCPTNNANQDNLPLLLEDEYILKLAEIYKKTPAQILIRWAMQRNTVVIPKSVTPEHIDSNMYVFDFELTDEQVDKMGELEKRHRFINPYEWWKIPYFS